VSTLGDFVYFESLGYACKEGVAARLAGERLIHPANEFSLEQVRSDILANTHDVTSEDCQLLVITRRKSIPLMEADALTSQPSTFNAPPQRND
jgi:hypothetical protein